MGGDEPGLASDCGLAARSLEPFSEPQGLHPIYYVLDLTDGESALPVLVLFGTILALKTTPASMQRDKQRRLARARVFPFAAGGADVGEERLDELGGKG